MNSNTTIGVLMKRFSLFFLIFSILTTYILITGFQCGSTEMTTAKLALKRGDYAAAEKSLSKETQKNPQNEEAWFFLGECQYQTSKYADMLTSYDNALKVNNTHENEIGINKHNAWIILMKSGGTYIDSANKQKDKMQMYANKALDTYQLAAKCVPDSAVTYQNLAVAYTFLKNDAEKIKAFETARTLAKSPTAKADITKDIVDFYIQKGEKLEAAGDTTAAMNAYNKASVEIADLLKANPSDKLLLQAMIDIDNKLGKSDEALEMVKALVAQDPKDKGYQNYLGFLLSKLGRNEEALEHIEAALEVDSNFVDALNNAGLIYDRIGQKLRTEFRESKEKNPVKTYLEKFKMCAKYFQRLANLKPDDANIWDALATSFVNAEMMSDYKKAAAKAEELRKNNK